MALTIYWTRRADKKFDAIISYLHNEWGEKVTSAFVKRSSDVFDLLSQFPEIGKIEHKERNIRGFVIVKQVSLFYKIRDEKLIILNFFDNRTHPAKKKY